jgi:hypothetical protein
LTAHVAGTLDIATGQFQATTSSISGTGKLAGADRKPLVQRCGRPLDRSLHRERHGRDLRQPLALRIFSEIDTRTEHELKARRAVPTESVPDLENGRRRSQSPSRLGVWFLRWRERPEATARAASRAHA